MGMCAVRMCDVKMGCVMCKTNIFTMFLGVWFHHTCGDTREQFEEEENGHTANKAWWITVSPRGSAVGFVEQGEQKQRKYKCSFYWLLEFKVHTGVCTGYSAASASS